METSQHEIVRQLSELKLRHVASSLERDLGSMPENEHKVLFKYLGKWLAAEKAERKNNLIASRIKSAKLGRIQTADTYNFKRNEYTERIEKNYFNLYASIAKDSLPSAVFSGGAGLGKTHLSRALGYGACQKGLSVLFVTAASMVNNLAHAQKTFSLEQELNKYRRPQVLIIDELGYVSLDTQASNLFFQVISSRHDAELGTIATTNIAFGQFNQIFANDAIAHAIVDRLVNEAEVFFMEGPSYRPEERKEKLKRKRQAN